MTNAFPELNWITVDGEFMDYHPTTGPSGRSVIFERASYDGGTRLYILKNLNPGNAKSFISSTELSQSRPDWNWETNRIALNVLGQKGNISICTVNSDGSGLMEVSGTQRLIHPQWTAKMQGEANGFVAMDNNSFFAPKSVLIDCSGNVRVSNLNGTDANGQGLYGGIPAVFPGKRKLIAFSGQPNVFNWAGNSDKDYNRNNNYIFLNAITGNGVFNSSPMEHGASIFSFDKDFQGCCPSISPDGKFVAFESNRFGDSEDASAIFLFDLSNRSMKAIQLTDHSVAGNARNPKFFPNGQRLVFSATNLKTKMSRLAWIDISSYLGL